MRGKLNCPNCGAPITDTTCPFCGSVFYDFATFDDRKPTYIRMNWNGQIITAKAVMQAASISMEPDAFPLMNIEFIAVPDDAGVIFKYERRSDE